MKQQLGSALSIVAVLGACSVINAPEELSSEGSGGTGNTGATDTGGKSSAGNKNGGGDTATGGTVTGMAGCGSDCGEGGVPPIGKDCESSAADCGSTAPICDATEFTCRACASNAECETDVDLPYCLESGNNTGRCAECRTHADCPNTAPVCSALGECRACSSHTECASGVCGESGVCTPEDQAVYALAQTGSTDGTCGTMANPCRFLSTAVMKLTAQRPTLVLLKTAAAFDYDSAPLPPLQGLTVIGNGVTVQSAAGQSVFRVPAGASATFEGVVVEGAVDEDEGGIECTNGEIVVNNSTLQDNGIGILAMDCDVTVNRSQIIHNANPLAFSQAGIVAGCTAASCDKRLIVTQNRFIDNGVAIYNWNQLDALIENNLFLRNGAEGYTRVIELRADHTRFAYNTLVENFNTCDSYIEIVACHAGVCDYVGNISFNNYPNVTEPCYALVWTDGGMSYSLTELTQPGATNKTGDPLFVDAANGDFTPGPGSPALDGGNPDQAPAEDIDGNPRGVAPDMGAFEAQ